jgi:hypothetical protein
LDLGRAEQQLEQLSGERREKPPATMD